MIKIDYTQAKILVVDDNPANIDILLEVLSDFDVRAALDGESALEAVSEDLPDLILLDIAMPGLDGFEVCRRLKKDPKAKSVPIIFLSANSDAKSIISGFELGGVDYITKPYISQEVIVRVQTHLKLQMSMRYLTRLANIDEMTGLSNRRHFFNNSCKLFETAKSSGSIFNIFVFDIDHFKQINDTYGHAVGDQVIKGFAAFVKKMVPELSCFARFGGDEFVMIIADTDHDEAKAQIKQLVEAIANTSLVPQQDIKTTTSVGMATLTATDHDIDALIARADVKLYEAKKTRNALVD